MNDTLRIQMIADVLVYMAAEQRKVKTYPKRQRRLRREMLNDVTAYLAAQLVTCVNCGAETLRVPDTRDAPRICYTWHSADGTAYADTCPGCGVTTLTTAPRHNGHGPTVTTG